MINKYSYIIQVKGQNLFLHKTSNMFTTDIMQARVYLNYKGAKHWIESRKEHTPYNIRFVDIEFEIREISRDVDRYKKQSKERNSGYVEQFIKKGY